MGQAYPAAAEEVEAAAVDVCFESSLPKILLILRLNLAMTLGLSPGTVPLVSFVDIVDGSINAYSTRAQF